MVCRGGEGDVFCDWRRGCGSFHWKFDVRWADGRVGGVGCEWEEVGDWGGGHGGSLFSDVLLRISVGCLWLQFQSCERWRMYIKERGGKRESNVLVQETGVCDDSRHSSVNEGHCAVCHKVSNHSVKACTVTALCHFSWPCN